MLGISYCAGGEMHVISLISFPLFLAVMEIKRVPDSLLSLGGIRAPIGDAPIGDRVFFSGSPSQLPSLSFFGLG